MSGCYCVEVLHHSAITTYNCGKRGVLLVLRVSFNSPFKNVWCNRESFVFLTLLWMTFTGRLLTNKIQERLHDAKRTWYGPTGPTGSRRRHVCCHAIALSHSRTSRVSLAAYVTDNNNNITLPKQKTKQQIVYCVYSMALRDRRRYNLVPLHCCILFLR